MEPAGRQALHTPPPPSDVDEDGDPPSLLQQARSLRPLSQALAILIVCGALCALGFSSVNLWRPVGVLMLRKLWDVLRFIALTTSIGVGIINSKLWRRSSREHERRSKGREAIYSSDGGSDHASAKAPFAGMFHSELQSSFSFDENAATIAEDGLHRTAREKHQVCDAAATAGEATAADHHNCELKLENASKLVNDITIPSGLSSLQEAEIPDNFTQLSAEGSVESNAGDCGTNLDLTNKSVNLVKASDDLNLGVGQRLKHGRTILHRRGASLDFPIYEDASLQGHGDGARTERGRRQGESTDDVRDKSSSSSSKATPFPGRQASDHARSQSTENLSGYATVEPASASAAMASSMHSRSQSAYDFNDLIAVQEKPRRRRAGGGQLARRRRVSLSCDLDRDYRAGSRGGSLPSWPEGPLSPPMPPQLINGGADRGAAMASKQDEKSLMKAFTESLAPWRVEAAAGEAQNEGRNGAGGRADSSKEAISQINAGRARAPLSPLTPKSMGSPSPSELNRKVDAFIARFHERNRIQRLESLERSRQNAGS